MTAVKVSDVIVGERHRSELGDIRGLADSILAVGLLHPIVLDPDRLLIAGGRRLEAWKLLHGDASKIPATIVTTVDSAKLRLKAEEDENICREPLLVSERVALADALAKLEQPKAKARMEAGRPSADSAQGRTREKVADAVGLSHDTLTKAREVIESANDASLPEEVRELAAAAVKQMDHTGKIDPAYRAVTEAKVGAHVQHNSGAIEWYTPEKWIEAARKVMGGIDLDPASCAEANETVGAALFYSEANDGLMHAWAGRVWMNPPYASDLIKQFCAKLVEEVTDGNVSEACALVNNATETGWFQTLARDAQALCFPLGRIKFWRQDQDSKTPLQGQCIAYFGPNADAFREVFGAFGLTVAP